MAEGRLRYKGELVDPSAITRTALSTIEAGRDDICGVGQTEAAHALCSGVRSTQRHRYVEPSVGHYGVFSGRSWNERIYPQVRDFIRVSDRVRPARR